MFCLHFASLFHLILEEQRAAQWAEREEAGEGEVGAGIPHPPGWQVSSRGQPERAGKVLGEW